MTDYVTIISQGRSGSSYLQYLLDSHPEVDIKGELLNPDFIERRYPALDRASFDPEHHLMRELGCDAPVVGFKMPWDWLLSFPETWHVFRKHRFKIIHLIRRNKVDQFLSVKLAQKNQNWQSREVYARQTLLVDARQLAEAVLVSSHTDYLLKVLCARFDSTTVFLEDLLAGEGRSELLRFIGVEDRKLRARTIKSRSRPKSEVIQNYEELCCHFAQSPIGRQLTD